uniref:Complement component C3 n=1 Tax=Sinohyriopsis cumingii TaxID=165450 RepID=A0A6M3W8I9_SINCU|nr:complement component C3 precursor [Sinohyriopsis cumingii]
MATKNFAVSVGLILYSVLTLANANEYYLLAAPKYLRFGVDETLSVSYHGNGQLDVTILLRHRINEFSVRQVTLRQGIPQLVNMQVTREDLGLDYENTVKPGFVNLVVKSRLARSSGEDTIKMLISYNTGYLFIQTDKPIYSPGFDRPTKAYIRVMPLDENFRPPAGKKVTVEIIDPREVIMSKKSTQFGHDDKFIRDEMILDSLAAKGIWTVTARFGDELETQTSAFFEVKEYVIPTFEVMITNVSRRYISGSDESLRINVKSMYVYGKPVRGTCSLRLKLKDEDGKEHELMPYFKPKELDSNGHVEIVIDVKNDLRPVLAAYDLEGKRLVLDATVQETTTGNTQTVRDQSVFFSNNPYVLKFSRSSSSFQPGYPYELRIDVFHLAGDPAAKIKLQVEINTFKAVITTDENGHALYRLNTEKTASQLQFKIKPDHSRDSIMHTVKKYNSNRYLQLEITDKQNMKLEARIDADAYDGVIILTLSRGRLYDSTFFPSGAIKVHDLSQWQHHLTPSGRSIAYFIHQDGEIVADQIKYDVRRTCFNRELTVKLTNDQMEPGHNIEMTVTGVENSKVGLGVIDKAVLLVSNRSNLLERSQMFDKMEAHDRGCTSGGGVDSVSVFRDAGMVVLTNARLIMESNTNLNCPPSPNRRRKRSTDVDSVCCKDGEKYAATIGDMTACVRRVLEMHKEDKNISGDCLNEFLKCCRDIFPEERSDGVDNIVLDFGEATKDLGTLSVRSKFEESWLFEEHNIGSSGVLDLKRSTPHSITEWRVQAIGMSSEYGICIAEPVTFKTFKNFFLQIDLPYKAVRLEQMNIKVTVFNYDVQNHWVNVYVEPWDTTICSSTKMGTKSEAKRVLVKANDAHTVTYPILPLKAGDTFLTVYGVIPGLNYDAVKKVLHIVNEGIEENEEIQLCLDPKGQGKAVCRPNSRVVVQNDPVNGQQIFTVDLTMPKNAIEGTGQCVMYLSGNNIMDVVVQNTIKDVNKLFRKVYPGYCGEQSMIALAPSVYAMMYLDKTKQLVETSDMERDGWRLINEGIQQEKKYKKADGSYSVWTTTAASTWLTAFVLKVFCQVDKLSDVLKQEDDIWPGLEWLARSKQNADGSFKEEFRVYHREMQGTDIGHLSLTAFTLITLQECRTPDMVSQTVNAGIDKAMKYVEGNYKNINDMYVLAIAAYALAISKSPHMTDANNRLKELSRTAGQDFRYWGLESEANSLPSAKTAETTCYALLTQLEFDDLEYARGIVNWLNANMNSVVCLQALSKYNIRTYNPALDLEVTVQADGGYKEDRLINREETFAKAIRNVPVGEKVTVYVKGKGAGRMSIDFLYNRDKREDEVCNFKIELANYTMSQEETRKRRNPGCDLCGFCPQENKANRARSRIGRAASSTLYCITVNISYVPKAEEQENAGMSIVDLGIQTGFKLVNDQDLMDLLAQGKINHFEKPGDTRESVILYVDEIPRYPAVLTFKFTLTKVIEVVNEIQPAAVTVYQYDDPDKRCTEFYNLLSRSSGEIRRSCEGRICECLEGTCPKCYEEEKGSIKGIDKAPFGYLMDKACDQSQADYIFHVKILKIHDQGPQNKADAEMIKVIKKGAMIHERGDTIYFVWDSICQCPIIKENKEYVIIAKDGPKHKDGIYLLRDSAIVWDDSVRLKRQKVSSFLSDIYRKRGCGV